MSHEPEVSEQSPVEAGAPQSPWLSRLLGHPYTPLAVGAAVLIGALAFFGVPRVPALGGRPDIVVFDPVKFLNAQRAAASILAVSPSADLTLTMTQVARQSEAVIKEEARGAVVLVKQSVVVPDGLPDITDAVLTRFGLPTTVPTVSTEPGKALEFVAPTDSAFLPERYKEDARVEQEELERAASDASARQDAHQKLIP